MYGLNSVLYRLTIILASLFLIVLFIIPITLVALLNAYEHWFSKSAVEWMG